MPLQLHRTVLKTHKYHLNIENAMNYEVTLLFHYVNVNPLLLIFFKCLKMEREIL